MLKDAIDLSGIGRVLVIKLRHHGDVLLTSPVFSTLKARLPQAKIDALVYADTREMLTLHPAIDDVHVIDRVWKNESFFPRLANELRLFFALRQRNYDLVIHLSDHPRGALLARLLRPRFSVAPGYAGRSKWWVRSFTHRFAMAKNPRRHMVEWNLDALRRVGIHPEAGQNHLSLIAGEQADAEVDALLGKHGLAEKGFIHFHPASRWQFKCWPVERTARLIDLLQEAGERVVLTGAPTADERALIEAILKKTTSRPLDLTGVLSLKLLASLTRRARLFIGVDSAPMHIAAAMGTPVVALFGPSGELEWGPWGVPHHVVASQLHPCRPCGNDGCGGSKVSDCLDTLPVEAALNAANDLLGR
jgi:heptosyltransferase-3